MESEGIKVTKRKYDYKILWKMVFMAIFVLIWILLAIKNILFEKISRTTYIWATIVFLIGGIGIGPGAHRFFCHRSYKVGRAMKIFLIFCQQVSGLKSVYYWCRVHRTHHKFSDTERDPTNIRRGFFYSFIGWLLVTPTPECKIEMERIHMDDLLRDKDLEFQDKYYQIFYITITLGLPSIVPYLFWSESLYIAFSINMFRYGLNIFQQIVGNSFLHANGTKPYDASISAIDNAFYNIITLGEGFHNFHHAFPFDYRSNELIDLYHIASLSTLFIDVCAALGLVYDRKFASPLLISRRITKTGDGTHIMLNCNSDNHLWGYGDSDMDLKEKDLLVTKI